MMSNVLIIGATGGVGSKLGPLLVRAGHQVTGIHRNPGQADALRESGIEPVLGDLMEMTADDFSHVAKGHDVIVFSAGAAGSGLDRTSAIDGDGVSKTIAAVSACMDAGRDLPTSEGFEHYMKTKKQADNALVASGLDWVILRPGELVSEDGNGLVHANLAVPAGRVARGNVAAMLAALIDQPVIRREIIEITDGDVPIHRAVKALLR
jgi:uncharacterized protein YbjT (DUF2867 family)